MNRDDPAVVLPRAVQEQAARSDELFRQLNEAPPNQPAPQTVADTPPAPTPTAPQPAPPSADTPTPPLTTTPVTTTDTPELTWENRYRVLQGKFNAEVPRLADDNRLLRQQVSQLQAEVETLKAGSSTTPQPPTQDTLVERFGPELAAEIRAEIAKAKGPTQESPKAPEPYADRDAQAFDAALTQRIPNWRTIDSTGDFKTFLYSREPMTNAMYGEMLNAAVASLDVERTVAIFDTFNRSHAIPDAPKPAAGTPEPPPFLTPRERLELQAVPAPSGGSGPAGAPEKRIWTNKEVAQEFTNIATGKYLTADAQKREAELNLAAAEGRIRN